MAYAEKQITQREPIVHDLSVMSDDILKAKRDVRAESCGKTDQDFTQRATTELRRRESATHLSVTSLKCYLSPTEHFQN
jgi:hypothetical protein